MASHVIHPELENTRQKLRGSLRSIDTLLNSLNHVCYPILYATATAEHTIEEDNEHKAVIRDARELKAMIQRDLSVLEKFLDNPRSSSRPPPSTNAPYLLSVWNEVIHAPQPIKAIWRTFSETPSRYQHSTKKESRRQREQKDSVKVDVVCNQGRQWIRVNTTKNSRMIAELTEIDSMLTDSEDELSEPRSKIQESDNSLIRAARSLLAAAHANPLPDTGQIPAITIRLTRLDPCPLERKDYDPRIAQTINSIRSMGIEVQLGERADAELLIDVQQPPPAIIPSTNINLDLSLLVALVSDLTHAPLPKDEEEAKARFTPSIGYIEWKKKRLDKMKSGEGTKAQEKLYGESSVENLGHPSQPLVAQVLDERRHGLFEEIATRITTITDGGKSVGFWTTEEARDRFFQIVGKIGGRREKKRAAALFACSIDRDELQDGLKAAREAFWQDSRYPKDFIPLLPLYISPSTGSFNPSSISYTHDSCFESPPLNLFFQALSRRCRELLSQDPTPDPRSMKEESFQLTNELEEIPRAAVIRANPHLTAHTVHTLSCGVARGWTTLAANRASVRTILRGVEFPESGLAWKQPFEETASGRGDVENNIAALWIVEPRSLAEGMRADYKEA